MEAAKMQQARMNNNLTAKLMHAQDQKNLVKKLISMRGFTDQSPPRTWGSLKGNFSRENNTRQKQIEVGNKKLLKKIMGVMTRKPLENNGHLAKDGGVFIPNKLSVIEPEACTTEILEEVHENSDGESPIKFPTEDRPRQAVTAEKYNNKRRQRSQQSSAYPRGQSVNLTGYSTLDAGGVKQTPASGRGSSIPRTRQKAFEQSIIERESQYNNQSIIQSNNWAYPAAVSLNHTARKKEISRINKENLSMLKTLKNVKPAATSTSEWRKHMIQSELLKKKLSRVKPETSSTQRRNGLKVSVTQQNYNEIKESAYVAATQMPIPSLRAGDFDSIDEVENNCLPEIAPKLNVGQRSARQNPFNNPRFSLDSRGIDGENLITPHSVLESKQTSELQEPIVESKVQQFGQRRRSGTSTMAQRLRKSPLLNIQKNIPRSILNRVMQEREQRETLAFRIYGDKRMTNAIVNSNNEPHKTQEGPSEKAFSNSGTTNSEFVVDPAAVRNATKQVVENNFFQLNKELDRNPQDYQEVEPHHSQSVSAGTGEPIEVVNQTNSSQGGLGAEPSSRTVGETPSILMQRSKQQSQPSDYEESKQEPSQKEISEQYSEVAASVQTSQQPDQEVQKPNFEAVGDDHLDKMAEDQNFRIDPKMPALNFGKTESQQEISGSGKKEAKEQKL